ncbi:MULTISPECIES: DUF554 domain-containing protein [Pantoea]|jgi:uncharacterized membrane protein YqgA involved in biofilm formation|uniref:DUF554 domain-containing protein n=1 Tax=Pantoea TaxID=53335 RepID=UPI000EA1728F|nr:MULTISPECIES: DUF554 domain-containing protein [Pantoea]MBZ6387301.1 DUF554 domain-containing protein [Pantoea piersonii]MBZ6402361.1 DUF554 domain-containing protein [Pantoea piersonii]MBZ6407445.1 DUF554 domain-containing protein [Pantoea piersonii]MBZ6426775.1 DUF554 domain-containing protein [Pantoea piersonii]NYB02148.1 DUF554 domain-containing protein [Pantoea piersonii]
MVTGPFVNGSAVLIGGIVGAWLGDKMPERLRVSLPMTFGLSSMGLGIVLIGKIHSLPAVILALILGAAIGELFFLEEKIGRLGNLARGLVARFQRSDGGLDQAAFTERYVAILVLFCASGTGIIGAMTEGMTHDPNILLVKSIMDIFTAAIFATLLGYAVAVIAVPQLIVQLLLASCAVLIMPHTSQAMMNDFTAAGGFVMLAAGFRIAGIKSFPVANMLPALLLVMPVSHLWTHFIH